MGAAVQNMAGLTEGDAQVIEVQISCASSIPQKANQ